MSPFRELFEKSSLKLSKTFVYFATLLQNGQGRRSAFEKVWEIFYKRSPDAILRSNNEPEF